MLANSFSEKLGVFVNQYPKSIILVILLLISLLSFGAKDIGFQSDYRVYFSQDNPQLKAFEAIQDEYNKSDNVLFVIEPSNKNVFDKDILLAIQTLTEKAWQIPYSNRVDSMTNFQQTIAEGDDLIVSDLVLTPNTLTPPQIQSIKQTAINEPLLVNRLVSSTGHVAGVNVVVQMPGKNNDEVVEITRHARKIASEIEASFPMVKIHLTGLAIMANAFTEEAMKDNVSLVPAMYGIVIFVLVFCLRSFSATIAVVILILFSSAATIGAAGWLGWSLNSTSAVSPIIILTLVVADSVHLLVSMLANMRLGFSKADAIKESIRINLQPIFLTSLTTAIGFLSMNFSDSPPFRDLGNLVAFGAMLALLLTVTFLPALINVLPIRVTIVTETQKKPITWLADFVIRRKTPLLIINLLFSLTFLSLLPLNQLNDEFVKYFDTQVDFRSSTDFLNENMGGIYTLEYAFKTNQAGDINEPKFLEDLLLFKHWLAKQKEIRHINTITDTYNRLNKSMHGDNNEWYKLPDSRELAAQYLLLYEMSLPYGLDLNDQINFDKSGVRVIVTIDSLSSNETLALESRINQWLQNNLSYPFQVSSPNLMFAHIGTRNISRMIIGTFAALVLISFILMLAFRSFKLGLISLIPNLLPAGVAFGIWGILQGNIGLALSVVTGITLGVVVDDTVHFISKYRRAKIEKQLNETEAVRYAFSTVGTALWITSIVLVSGFLMLGLSNFTMNSELGIMTALTIFIALILDFLLLPPLLMLFDKKK